MKSTTFFLILMCMWVLFMGALMAAQGCAVPSAEVGFYHQLIATVEDIEQVECPAAAPIVCTGGVAVNVTRDLAAVTEAIVVRCSGEYCLAVYRMRCDLAGCETFEQEYTHM